MKKIILLFALLISTVSFAQSGNFNYKALLVENGSPVANAIVTVKVKLKNGTSSATRWYEQHDNVHTDANGIFTINIGTGTRISGAADFDGIDWKLYSDMKLTVEVDNGSGFNTLVDNVAFGSVPYAKKAETVGTLKSLKIDVGTNSMTNGLTVEGGVFRTNSLAYFRLQDGNANQTAVSIYLAGTPDANSYYIKGDGKFSIKSDGTMYLGGEFHGNGTGSANMMPIAYGTIKADGTILIGTDNFTVSTVASGEYKITLSSYSDLQDINTLIIATPGIGSGASFIRAYAPTTPENYIYVKTMNNTGGLTNKQFQFIIYKK